MTSGQSTAQRKLTSQDGGTNNTGQAAGVVSGVGRVRSPDAKKVKHGALGLEDSTTTKSSDLKRGHRNGNLERSSEAVELGALNDLSRVLTSGQEDGSNHVGSRVDVALENTADNIARDNSLSDNTLTTSVDPVQSSGLLVCAVVTGDRDNLHVVEARLIRHDAESVFNTLGNHVHTHSVTSGSLESNVQVGTSESGFHRLESGKATGGVESLLHHILTGLRVKPDLGSTGTLESLKRNTRTTSHTISSQDSDGTAARVDSLAASAGTGDQNTFSSSHGDEVALSINDKRSSNTDREGHVSDNLRSVERVCQVGGGFVAGDDGTSNLDSTSEVTKGLFKSITRNLAAHRQGDNFLVAHLTDALLGQKLLKFLVASLRRGARLSSLRSRGNVFAERKGSGASVVELLRTGKLVSVDVVLGNVRILDTPAGDVEQITVEGDAQSKGDDNPLREDRIFKRLEDTANHAASDAVTLEVMVESIDVSRIVCIEGRAQGVVNRGILKLVLDGSEHGNQSRSVVGSGGGQDGIQTVGSNLEGVNRQRSNDATQTAGPGADGGQRGRVAERNRADVDNVDEDETEDHQNLEGGDAAALATEQGRVSLGARQIIFTLGNVLGNPAADTIILKSHSHIDVTLDTVDLKLDAEDSSVEGEKENEVEQKSPSSEEAELLKTTLNTGSSTNNEDDNLNGIIAHDLETLLLNGGLNGILDHVLCRAIGLLARLGVLELRSSVLDSVGHDSAGQDNVLLEADGDDEERKTLGEKDNTDRNTELGGDQKTKEEGENRGEQSADAEPELGTHLAHREEEGHEGQVHGNVAQEHDNNVEGLGVLEEVNELSPGVAEPLDHTVLSVDLGSLHDPCLLLATVLGLSLDGILVGDLLGSSEKFGTLSVGKRVGEDGVLGVGGERVVGRRKRRDRQVLGNRHVLRARCSAGRLGRESIREDKSQESKVVGSGTCFGDRVLLDDLPVPRSLRTCA
ncbi:hypothetical protein HG530_009462 [Fusarium avenaceum]|nr:hypothetical protein HG530_009462 [Fusarium avenaceum]